MLNTDAIIKGKLDSKLNEAFKNILSKLNITQQEFIEVKVKEFVLENLNLLIPKNEKGNKDEKQ